MAASTGQTFCRLVGYVISAYMFNYMIEVHLRLDMHALYLRGSENQLLIQDYL